MASSRKPTPPRRRTSPLSLPRITFRQVLPLLLAAVVIVVLAMLVLPDDEDPPAVTPVSAFVLPLVTDEACDDTAVTPTSSVSSTPDPRTPVLIEFSDPKATPTPRQIRRQQLSPTPSPTPEFLPEQLLVNGGAEQGLEGWYVESGVATTTDPVHGGSQAILLATSGGFASSQITVVPGTTYRLSAWGVVSSDGADGEIGVNFFDASGQRINPINPPILHFTEAEFARQDITFTPADGVTRMEIYLWNPPGSTSFVIDDISVRAYSGDPNAED